MQPPHLGGGGGARQPCRDSFRGLWPNLVKAEGALDPTLDSELVPRGGASALLACFRGARRLLARSSTSSWRMFSRWPSPACASQRRPPTA